MSETCTGERGVVAVRAGEGLALAAAPTFAAMAALTAVLDVGTPDMLCAPAAALSPLNGMAAMYLLMAVFHAAPWLRRISRRQSR